MTVGADKLFIPNKAMSPVTQPGYGTDMRTLETFLNSFETGTITEITSSDGSVVIIDSTGPVVDLSVTASGGYASLTGPGETTSPGALTQDGAFTIDGATTVNDPFTVDDSTTGGVSIKTDGTALIGHGLVAGTFSGLSATSTLCEIGIASFATSFIQISNGDVGISANGSTITVLHTTGIEIVGTTDIQGNLEIHDVLGSSAASFEPNTTGGVNSSEIGFYGVSPVARQSGAAITTVAQLVTALQNLGLLS